MIFRKKQNKKQTASVFSAFFCIFREKMDIIKKTFVTFANRNRGIMLKKDTWLYRIYDLYQDGFRHMTIGRTLWLIILIKLFVIFVVLKIFFFPNYLKSKAGPGQEAEYVNKELIERIH